MFSAARISTIRKSKGFSQELLAEQSGVSLRTIQRVEQGDTVPRGHTLQALATALEVPLEALWAAPAPAPETPLQPGPVPGLAPAAAAPALRADLQFLQLLNLSALSLLLFPLLNIVVPWLLWRAHRHDTEHVAELGRRVLGFQILWQVGSFFAYFLAGALHMVARTYDVVVPNLFLGVFLLTYLVDVVMICYSGWQLRQGRLDVYRFRL